MSINIIQLVQGALTESVLQQLATKFGVAPEAAKRVVGLVAPALVGSLMNKAASPEGARSLFSSIMSPDSNANIVDMLKLARTLSAAAKPRKSNHDIPSLTHSSFICMSQVR